jgi:GNAT superfamily N-acetyltransferase
MTPIAAVDERRAVRARRPRPRGAACDPSSSSGAAACIRPLREDDGALLDMLVAGLSPQSRYQRFHAPKPHLTAADRAELTRVDGRDRLGLIALTTDGQPLAVAHAVRLPDDPGSAELGAVVVDARQREGLGTELIRRLAQRAAGVGVERLVARVLAESGLASRLLRTGWRLAGRDGPVVTLVVDARRAAGAASPLSA